MKALVSGGAGFIGSHLVERLLLEGHEVTVVDDFSTGRRSNLHSCAGHPRLTVVESDIAEAADLSSVFSGGDVLFHLAALADIVPSIQRPEDYFRANVLGTLRVLEAARIAGVGRFLYAASTSCYGLAQRFPTPETAPIRPEYPYALMKWLGEEMVLRWGEWYRLGVLSLRLSNVYGPRSRTTGAYGGVFGVFLAQRRRGQPLTIVGDGTQTRDFVYVSDVVEAFLRAANSSCRGEAFNVGSGGTYPIHRLAALIGGPVTFIPKRPGEPDCTFADL